MVGIVPGHRPTSAPFWPSWAVRVKVPRRRSTCLRFHRWLARAGSGPGETAVVLNRQGDLRIRGRRAAQLPASFPSTAAVAAVAGSAGGGWLPPEGWNCATSCAESVSPG